MLKQEKLQYSNLNSILSYKVKEFSICLVIVVQKTSPFALMKL